jgi:hypothetical protein
MIKYTLACENRHTFESWFASSGAYDKQAKKKLVTCPICDSAKVEKALMAPQLTARSNKRRSRLASSPLPLPAPAIEAAPEAPALPMVSPQEKEFRAKPLGVPLRDLRRADRDLRQDRRRER